MTSSSEYMNDRRENNPLQYYQDAKDSLKARIVNAKKESTKRNLIEEYGKAVLALDSARRLYRTR